MIMILTQRAMKLGAMTYIKARNRLLTGRLPKPDIYYFGYGGNLTTDRFRKYEMNVEAVDVAKLDDFALSFTLPCEYKGKGFASVEKSPGRQVWGRLYKLDRPSLFLLDVMEWAILNQYRRISLAVETRSGEKRSAFVYQAKHPRECLSPSVAYKEGIVKASRAYQFPISYIEQIERTNAKERFELDHGFSLMFPNYRRPAEKYLVPIYRIHDRFRETICNWLQF